MHFRDKSKMGQGDCVSHASRISKLSGSTPGSAPPTHLSPSLSSFSSMGCKGLRVPVLITEERCRAWTPGLTARCDSLWDHSSPDGIARRALSPQSLAHVCVKLCCQLASVPHDASHLPASLKIFTTAWIEPNPVRCYYWQISTFCRGPPHSIQTHKGKQCKAVRIRGLQQII